ncbi:hypothetical protein [Streptomyces sp. NPDC048527]|uniref:hypothetical protein n=1 Tax=Streptomyces sp. NPDC048527 TaxID=3365568 RepID=UPI00371F186F
MGELVEIPDDGTALAVAARFADSAAFSSHALLRMWQQASDPDGFSAALLAPALARENQTSLRLRGMTSLTGLRHLTTLQILHIDRCKEITDVTEVGALTHLTELDLNGCAGIQDLPPIWPPHRTDPPQSAPLPVGGGHRATARPEETAGAGPQHDQGAVRRRFRQGVSRAHLVEGRQFAQLAGAARVTAVQDRALRQCRTESSAR